MGAAYNETLDGDIDLTDELLLLFLKSLTVVYIGSSVVALSMNPNRSVTISSKERKKKTDVNYEGLLDSFESDFDTQCILKVKRNFHLLHRPITSM